MYDYKRRLIAVGCGAALLLSTTACTFGSPTDSSADESGDDTVYTVPVATEEQKATVMTVNGEEVPAYVYAANYIYSKYYLEQSMSQYGLDSETLWNMESIGDSYKAQLTDTAYDQTVYMYVMPQKMEELGLTLTDEEQSNKDGLRDQLISVYGSENEFIAWMQEMGYTEDVFERIAMTSACATHLEDYYFGENGIMIPPEEDIRAYFDENYYHAKHILIMSVDPDTNEEYSEDELAEREQLAKEIAQRAANGEDFDTLMNEYSEDTGLSSNPDGYVFTEGDMVTEFYDGTAALAVGEISEPIKSSYGWHIIERLPLTDDDYEANRDDVRVAASGSDINTLALEWIDAADVQTTDLYDSITFDNIDTYKAKAVE